MSQFSIGGSVLGIGFVSPFGKAPPDFTAVTIANGTIGKNVNCNGGNNNCTCNGNSSDGGNNNCINVQAAQLDIDWGNSGTATPFKTLAPTGLDLDRSNASIGSNHEIETDQGNINIESLAVDVSITGSSSGMDLFSITRQRAKATDSFGSFADFEAALAADLDGTTMALRLTTQGQFDAASNTFTAQRITILLSN